MYNSLIHGKCELERIVSCEVKEDLTELFLEQSNGNIVSEFKPNRYWLLAPIQLDEKFTRLDGKLYYNWIKVYKKREAFLEDRKRYYKKDIYSIHDEKEAAMVMYGFTYFKGLQVNDVSLLGFDIESTSLEHTEQAKVLLISNTFRKNGQTIRKLFSYDEYETEAGMFDAWCEWVRDVNPTIMLGHNIFMYDLPYLNFCAERANTSLNLGRDGSAIRFNSYSSKFRKDGSQFYEYKKCYIYGREIIDTMFLAYKYDFSRKYESYRLKSIIKSENLEVKDRQFYDAEQIRYTYKNPEEWEKIKRYAINDADDAIALYDLMIPAYFYLNQTIPKSFQQIITSASGSQVNSFLVRSYLQHFHSIPRTSEGNAFEGAISLGNPGVYFNCWKADVASLYPSIILEYNVYDKYKDPNKHFLQMVEYFTNERLENKRKGKETGDRYYKDLDQAGKIIVNSSYGLLGATGLNFNSLVNASFVTRKGREVLQKSIEWCNEKTFQLINGDTDSISLCKQDRSFISKEERDFLLSDLNSLFPERIHFEDDGYYPFILVVKVKNYVLKDEAGKIKIKGSALKASMKESALKEFIKKVIDLFVENKQEEILNLYYEYVKEIHNITDIKRWTSRKTITEKVLNAERTNEQKVLDAIEGEELQEGDKIQVYFDINGALKIESKWNNDHDTNKLLNKLYKTLEIFDTVLNIESFPKFHLKNFNIKCQLHDVLGLPHPEKIKRTRKKKENEVYPTADAV